MTGEPRPRLRDRKVQAALVALLLGALGWALTLSYVSPGIGGVLLQGLSRTLFTVAFYECFQILLLWLIWRAVDRRAFDGFFGEGASDRAGAGVIVLQSDCIDALLERYGVAADAIDSRPAERLFKARDWINYHDMEAARALIGEFRRLGLDAPRLLPVQRGGEFPAGEAPFWISTGLGFSARTRELTAEIGKGWLEIWTDAAHGDGIALLRELAQGAGEFDGEEYASATQPGLRFRKLIPRGWSLAQWRRGETRDYAVIVRHTRLLGGRALQVCFALAGFSERGTAAAGAYLARHWQPLWRQRVCGRAPGPSRGDFLLLIEGPASKSVCSEAWRECCFITPELLAQRGIALPGDSPWGERMAAARLSRRRGRRR